MVAGSILMLPRPRGQEERTLPPAQWIFEITALCLLRQTCDDVNGTCVPGLGRPWACSSHSLRHAHRHRWKTRSSSALQRG